MERNSGINVPVQFSIRSMLLVTLLVAVLLSLVRVLGGAAVPCVFGILGASVGYAVTVLLRRRRVFDVVVWFFVGALAGTAAFERLHGEAILHQNPFDASRAIEGWMLISVVVGAVEVAGAAALRFYFPFASRRDGADLADDPLFERRLSRIRRMRRIVFVLCGAVIAFMIGIGPVDRIGALSVTLSLVVFAACVVATFFILVGIVTIAWDVFWIALEHRGPWYATGHVLLYLLVWPISFVVVPLLIQGDLARSQPEEKTAEKGGRVDAMGNRTHG